MAASHPSPSPGAGGAPGRLDHLDALGRAQDAFAAELAASDPDATVPTCDPWTVTDLALHLAGVHRWAAAMARGVETDDSDPVQPRAAAAVRAFYDEQAQLLRMTLRDLGPDAPALTLVGPGPASFWRRRQLHETLVHLTDLVGAAGPTGPTGTADVGWADAEIWSDTVDEVVTVMAPRQVRLGRTRALLRAVGLVATDTGRTWTLTPADPSDDATPVPVPAPVSVAGPARSVALLLWGRVRPDDPTLLVTGDRTALDDALSGRLVP